MNKKAKHTIKKNKNSRKLVGIIFIIFIALIITIIYLYNKNNNNILNNIVIDTTKIANNKTERMLQVEELKKENEDVVGWLQIEDSNINFPVLQGSDNEYYITHNYKKEKSKDGAIFLDKDYNWDIPSSNLLIYGHNNKNGNMFQELLNYKEESYYLKHPIIKFTTINEDSNYEIISVFLSRVYYKNEKDVFRYYYFINANNEEEYNNYVSESKKASLYDTGKTAKYGNQLLTLSTCEYSQEDGRFVVIARKQD